MAMAIPVITRSPPGGTPIKPPPTKQYNPRQTRSYAPGPLPTKLSSTAPRNARITARIISPLTGAVHYDLSIGDVPLPDVTVEEILDYVSPLELEAWEHAQFEEERGVLAAYEAAREEERAALADERRERAKLRGVGGWEEVSSSDGEEGTGSEGENGQPEAEVGKHGRARPTYTHLFKVPEIQRRRRVRSSTEEDEGRRVTSTVEDERVVRSSESVPGVPEKRRRRKRDKITGELLPLSPRGEQPQQQLAPKVKRPRRRRHPITRELMPLGWRYDPTTNDQTRNNDESDDDHVSPNSFQHLRISPTAKRPRLDMESSMSRSISPAPSKIKIAERVAVPTPSKVSPAKALSKPDSTPRSNLPASVKPTPRLSQPVPVIDMTSSPEPEPEIRVAQTKSPRPTHTSPQKARTSLIHPTAPLSSSSSSASEDSDDNDEDEWVVESILSHQYSDPRTHPASAGTKPIMLYQTKWVGSEEVTWEPLDSFGDWGVVTEYRRKAGLRPEPSDDEHEQGAPQIEGNDDNDNDDNEEEDDEADGDEFEIEAIHAHHLSDPRTHPVELGKMPVMLYEVKWKGWEETTWEPVGSFVDARILGEYHRRVGL